jgi:hypothetical protein
MVGAVLALAVPVAAQAQTGDPAANPTVAQYQDPGRDFGGGAAGDSGTFAGLPLTGLDLAVLAAAAAALLAGGVALRTFGRGAREQG